MKNAEAAAAWPQTKVIGKLSKKASAAVERQCLADEAPWLILTSAGGAGTLVAWADRLAIIKTGAMTSLMAGSLGGERAATFHFADITGIEYNSGLVNGVLEILTPSYSGTRQKDFWRGTLASRNANADDPWTLSNTLPLPKPDYRAAEAEIKELRERVGAFKRGSQAGPSADLPDQLQRLSDLRAAGVLSEDEFAAAKARLLNA